MSKKEESLCQKRQEILETIRKESSYRPIVPFLGAGISVSAGFPTIRFVIQYLAKVDFAIQYGVFKDRFPKIKEDHQWALDNYSRHPSKYLEDFGWPNLGQLNADIWEWLERPLNEKNQSDDIKKPYKNGVGRKKIWEVSNEAVRLAISDYKEREQRGENLGNKKILLDLLAYDVGIDKKIKKISEAVPNILEGTKPLINKSLALRDHQQAIVQWTLRKELTGRESGANQAMLKEWLQWKSHYHYGNESSDELEPSLLYGDWEMLLDKLCEGNFNLIDALFTSFENGLNPTLSHRYLAFLQPKLGIPLLLTTNFDSLLERAFYQEGIPPKVFDVHKDAELPNQALVHRQLSLLKLHGSAYGLRLGERLKYTLEIDARNNALGYIPKDALILVMGFNGSERRIMQILQAFVQERERGSDKPRLIWIQGPSEPGPLFNELIADSGNSVQRLNVRHIDTFLQELYLHITCNSYQSTSRSYSTISSRPLTTGLKTYLANTKKEKEEKRRPVHLCIGEIDNGKPSSNWSSLAGMAFVNSLDNGYTVIWIDLENHHTVEGIIAEFFNRVRLIDPQIPSCAITNMDVNREAAISKAIERIHDVFKRGRYVLVLDMVESFGRPQMVHHGIPSSYEKRLEGRSKGLWRFLKELLHMGKRMPAPNYWDSYIIVTADKPRLRHHLRSIDNTTLLKSCKSYKYAYLLIKSLQRIGEEQKLQHICLHHQKNEEYKDLISEKNLVPEPDPSTNLSAHWRYSEANLPDNSLKRAKNVLFLLNALRSEDNAEESKLKKLSEKTTTEAFICLLSIFRRPRSLPLLRSIVERWGLRKIGENLLDDEVSAKTHAAINELLQLIVTIGSPVGSVVSQNHEGGSVWLFREVYEAIYDALTEQLHLKAWIDAWKLEIPCNKPSSSAAIMDGVLSITWHLFAARAYYVDIFLPTHDIRSFWEYLYHRVSAIRIIILLITIIEKDFEKGDKTTIWNDLSIHCKELSSVCETFPVGDSERFKPDDDNPFEWYVWVLGIFDPIKRNTKKISSAQELVENFKLLRKNSLDTLLMALKKNKLLFRIEAAPDSILAWSDQFLEFELTNMKGISGHTSECPIEIKETLDELSKLFEKLKYQALLSKMDYKSILSKYGSESNFKKEKNNFNKIVKELIKLEKNLKDKGETATNKDNKNFSEKFQGAKEQLNNLLNIARCLVHPGDHRAEEHTQFILDKLDDIKGRTTNTDIESWVKRKQLVAHELRGRSWFIKWPFWHPLLERKDSDSRIMDDKLRKAEIDSVLFEDLLRETTKTNDEDTKNRSNALTIRVRALYLRGHFPQAHHFLDLASTGLFPERIDHWSLISVVHIIRAELLAISAHEHYFSLSKRDQVREKLKLDGTSTQDQNKQFKKLPRKFAELAKELHPIAASSLKKIERAEQELRHAEKLLRNMAHQNIWLIRMEFGWAQIKVERMLFEIELLFLSWQSLTVTEYLKKSGELEQAILDTMQRLRNVLDIIPYQSQKWTEMNNNEMEPGQVMFQIECSVYKLWRQLFVVGACYSSLLNCLYIGTGSLHYDEETSPFDIADLFIQYLSRLAEKRDNAMKYREQWKLWCIAMRFDSFSEAENMKTFFNSVSLQTEETFAEALKSISFRAAVIKAMRNECTDEKIEIMWNIRRDRRKTHRADLSESA